MSFPSNAVKQAQWSALDERLKPLRQDSYDNDNLSHISLNSRPFMNENALHTTQEIVITSFLLKTYISCIPSDTIEAILFFVMKLNMLQLYNET